MFNLRHRRGLPLWKLPVLKAWCLDGVCSNYPICIGGVLTRLTPFALWDGVHQADTPGNEDVSKIGGMYGYAEYWAHPRWGGYYQPHPATAGGVVICDTPGKGGRNMESPQAFLSILFQYLLG